MNRVKEELTRAESQLHTVQQHMPPTVEEFKELGIVRDGIYKNLEDAIQNIIDACAHLIKEKKLGIPTDEYNIFTLLKENSCIDEEEYTLLKELRGLRNRLVHRYGTIDDEVIFTHITTQMTPVSCLITTLRDLCQDDAGSN